MRQLLILLIIGTVTQTASGTPDSYRVKVDPALQTLDIQACFGKRLPDRLIGAERYGARYLQRISATIDQTHHTLRAHGNTIPLSAFKSAPGCVEYRVELKPDQSLSGRARIHRLDHAMLLPARLWFWHPQPRHSTDLHIQFNHPAGMQISTPWIRLAQSKTQTTFRVGHRPLDWSAKIVLGRFQQSQFTLGKTRFNIAVLPGQPQTNVAELEHWIQQNAKAIASIHGSIPITQLQVLVHPVARGEEPVPWAQVLRGGGDAIYLVINQHYSRNDFLDDWTLSHELSHLLHPRLQGEWTWLYEGLASYYQNVSRARTGMHSSKDAWEKLHAGFQRGLKQSPMNQSLAQVSENMGSNRLYMRVYWSGAAIALMADVKLRSLSHNQQSLDTVLAAFGECCLPSERFWNGREFMQNLDQISNTTVFTDLHDRHINDTGFPDLEPVYQALGISIGDQHLHFNDHARYATIRKAIMSPVATRP